MRPGLHMWMQEELMNGHDAGWTLGRRAKDCSKEEETILDDVDAPELVRSFEGSSIQTAHAHTTRHAARARAHDMTRHDT